MLKAISILSSLPGIHGRTSFAARWESEVHKLDDFETDCKKLSLDVVHYKSNGCGTEIFRTLVQDEFFKYLESKTLEGNSSIVAYENRWLVEAKKRQNGEDQIQNAGILANWVVDEDTKLVDYLKKIRETQQGAIQSVQDKAKTVTSQVLETREFIHTWGTNQKSIGDLLDIYGQLMIDMEKTISCNVELTKLGEDLFLRGDEQANAKDILGKHCSVIEDSEYSKERIVKRIDSWGDSRRRLESSTKKTVSLAMNQCYQKANFSRCIDPVVCKKEEPTLFGILSRMCASHIKSKIRMGEHNLLTGVADSLVSLDNWLDLVKNVTRSVRESSQSCSAESIKLRVAYEDNVLNLAKVSRCHTLGVQRWREIWQTCSDMKNLYLYPFINLYYIIRYNCIKFLYKMLGLGITILSFFLLAFTLKYLICCCKGEKPTVVQLSSPYPISPRSSSHSPRLESPFPEPKPLSARALSARQTSLERGLAAQQAAIDRSMDKEYMAHRRKSAGEV